MSIRSLGMMLCLSVTALFLSCAQEPGSSQGVFISKPAEKFLFSQNGKAGDEYGKSVAMSGNGKYVLVGAPGIQELWQQTHGAAYLYEWNDSLGWIEIKEFIASDGAWGDSFGRSVAISDDGSVIAVGAYSADIGANSNCGAVYVYKYTDGKWNEIKLISSISTNKLKMGENIDISPDGGTIVAGARGYYTSRGCVVVFRWDGNTYNEYILVAADATAIDENGFSVAVSAYGYTVVSGAWINDIAANTDQGCAYVFRWNGSGYVQNSALLASDGLGNDQYGYSVDVSDDGQLVAVGSFNADSPTTNSTGAIYLYKYKGFWDETKLIPTNALTGDHLGTCVKVSGDGKYVMGAALFRNNSQGVVYRFVYDSEYVWTQDKEIIASDPGNGDYFGYSIGLSYDCSDAVIGANLDDVNGLTNMGSAYIYHW